MRDKKVGMGSVKKKRKNPQNFTFSLKDKHFIINFVGHIKLLTIVT